MATSFHNAVLGLNNALRSSRGLAVTYCRGDAAAEVTAVAGQSRVSVEDASGMSVSSKRRDWIIRADQLVLGGQKVLPQVGDTIRLVVGEASEVYEVQRLAGESHYYACDELGQVLRIHTRLIGS